MRKSCLAMPRAPAINDTSADLSRVEFDAAMPRAAVSLKVIMNLAGD